MSLCLQENQFLLSLGITCAVLAGTAVALMFVMRRSFAQEQQHLDQVGRNLPAHLTADRTPQQRMKDCYLNKGGPALQEMLRYARPGRGYRAAALAEQPDCVQLAVSADKHFALCNLTHMVHWPVG